MRLGVGDCVNWDMIRDSRDPFKDQFYTLSNDIGTYRLDRDEDARAAEDRGEANGNRENSDDDRSNKCEIHGKSEQLQAEARK